MNHRSAAAISYCLLVAVVSAVLLSAAASRRDHPSSPPSFANLMLQQVQIVFRHGDRSPLNFWPGPQSNTGVWNCSDFYNVEYPHHVDEGTAPLRKSFERLYLPGQQALAGSCVMGQLTHQGAAQQYTLGQDLRQRYIVERYFLPDSLDESRLFVRSTDIYRTRQSVEAQLLGMYPSSKRPSDRPIPIYTVDQFAEFLYPNTGLCPHLGTLMEKLKNTSEWQETMRAAEPLLMDIAAAYKVPPSKLPGISGLLDLVTCFQAHDIPFQPGFTEEMAAQVQTLAGWTMGFTFGFPGVGRLSMGPFIHDLVASMKATVANESSFVSWNGGTTPSRPWMAWSAHDSTLGPLMAALGLYSGSWPGYADHAIFELYQSKTDSSQWFVKVMYNFQDKVLAACDGQTLCPLEKFATATAPLIPENYASECRQTRFLHPHDMARLHLDDE